MSTTSNPYLSIVATCRNDDHGGNLLGRMQVFASALLGQIERHKVDAELIIVEWNPPADRPRLREALRWDLQPHSRVRIVEVPPEVHARLQCADKLPLFQMIGKNVGIRRARGRFVLCTNIDILYSDELIAYLAQEKLDARRMYRIDRYDAPPEAAADTSAAIATSEGMAKLLAFCKAGAIRIAQREGQLDLRTGNMHRIFAPTRVPPEVVRAVGSAVPASVREKPALRRFFGAMQERDRLHTNGCGDFTLAARERWDAIRGYAEFEMYSMHIDALGCYSLHFGGARERVLEDPMRVYHIEHGAGSGFTPEGQRALDERLAKAGIPQLSHDEFEKYAVKMRNQGSAEKFNGETWGMANESLPETTLTGAGQ